MEIANRMVTPTRLQVKGWARVGPAGAHTLRRGAWYPVVRISSSNIVVLDDLHWADVPSLRLLEFLVHEIADSSVFPAAAAVNPALTIAALALRTAEHGGLV